MKRALDKIPLPYRSCRSIVWMRTVLKRSAVGESEGSFDNLSISILPMSSSRLLVEGL